MTHNTFGNAFRFTTFGESHGPMIGCVIDGVPPGIALAEGDIQQYLDQRKPAQSRFTTQRKEDDAVRIVSGVFEGKTTGTPIGLLIENTDSKSKDYDDIKDKFRPGHADYTYFMKYGLRDYRGGGRSSARETAMRVAAGAVARKILHTLPGLGISIRGALVQMGEHAVDRTKWDWAQVNQNPFWCPDAAAAHTWEGYVDAIRKEGSSIGAVCEVVAENVPPGWGAPLYRKLDAELASAMMGINAVKGVEIGDGFATATMRGEQNADRMRADGAAPYGVRFESNHAGGILGGISTGQPIVVRLALKPTSSILSDVDTVDVHRQNTTIRTKGRHDPCVGIRAVPVAEAMMACVLADQFLMHRAQVGGA